MRLLLFVGTGVVLAVLFVVALVVVFRLNRPGRGREAGDGQQPGYGQHQPADAEHRGPAGG